MSDADATGPRLYPTRDRALPDRAPRDLAAELNAEQARAATFGDGPLLVIAGAGTGKTRTLVYRVAHLIQRGVAPERILLLTFTRRAAQEMLSRAERLVGGASTRVQGGTFHATGHRLLRQFGPAAGLPRDFSIMDQGDAEDLMQLSRAALGYGKQEKRFPKKESLQYIYSRHVNTEIPVEDIVHEDFPQFLDFTPDIVRIFGDYTTRKGARNLVDYDDLLLFWQLMLEAPQLGERIAAQYDHVLVDEYQDTNLLQAQILRGLCRAHRNLTVVGDDAQSIYSFRGANFRNILDFPSQFPGTTMITLEQNYRSTQPILDATNTLISRALERFTKNLWTARTGGDRPWLVTARDEQQQTRFVVDRILELHEAGTPLHEMAVLFRAGYMSADLEIELTNRQIPFEKWGGLKFLEAAHVKDVLAFLRVLENPRDEVSWYRILMLMPGIGDVTARAMMQAMADRSWDPDAFTHFTPPPKAREAHGRLSALLRSLRRRGRGTRDAGRGISRGTPGAGSPKEPGIRDSSGSPESGATNAGLEDLAADMDLIRGLYDEILREKYDRPDARIADLDQLRVIAGGYPSRAAFLAAIALEPPQSTQDLASGGGHEDDALILSTAHSAKGKEWDAVFLIWAVDGWFPMARATEDEDELEEERRLMYVALTRARNHLAVTYPLHVYNTRRGADYSLDQLSRFIDRGVRERMERVTLKDDEKAPGAVPPAGTAPELDLRALLRGRFGG